MCTLDEEASSAIATALSFEEAGADAPRVDEARSMMPQDCKIFPIEPGGWCFYECVAKQLRRSTDPGEFDRSAVAAMAIEQLILQRHVREGAIVVNEIHQRNHAARCWQGVRAPACACVGSAWHVRILCLG